VDPRFVGSNPTEGDKNPEHTLLKGEVKPPAPCYKILRYRPFEVWDTRYVPRALLLITLLVELPESSGGRMSFPPINIIRVWLSMLIYNLGDE
jgi:hypothetical protein